MEDSNGDKVFGGTGGRALVFLKLFEATKNSTYLKIAQDYVETMERGLTKQKIQDDLTGFVGFLWSHVGMLCVSALAADFRGDNSTVQDRVDSVRELFNRDTIPGKYDDFDSGRAGLIYAARFLKSNVRPRNVDKIDPADVAKVVSAIIDRGYETGIVKNGNTFLQWHGPNDDGLWLGQSHGSAGILQQVILGAPQYLAQNQTAAVLVERTFDEIVDSQFVSGNFPSEYYDTTQDVLVQWDHGAPGISAALIEAYAFFNKSVYLESAQRALDCTWRRGLSSKGLMNCHGISGNTWMFLSAAKRTSNLTYVYRAMAFQDIVVNSDFLSDPEFMRQPQPEPDTPWHFWVGSYESSIELWTDFLYKDRLLDASETGFMAGL